MDDEDDGDDEWYDDGLTIAACDYSADRCTQRAFSWCSYGETNCPRKCALNNEKKLNVVTGATRSIIGPVASLGDVMGRIAPGNAPPGCDTRLKLISFVAEFRKNTG